MFVLTLNNLIISPGSNLEAKLKEETDNLDRLERAQKEMEKRQLSVQKKLETIEQTEKELCDTNEEALRNLTLKLDDKKE